MNSEKSIKSVWNSIQHDLIAIGAVPVPKSRILIEWEEESKRIQKYREDKLEEYKQSERLRKAGIAPDSHGIKVQEEHQMDRESAMSSINRNEQELNKTQANGKTKMVRFQVPPSSHSSTSDSFVIITSRRDSLLSVESSDAMWTGSSTQGQTPVDIETPLPIIPADKSVHIEAIPIKEIQESLPESIIPARVQSLREPYKSLYAPLILHQQAKLSVPERTLSLKESVLQRHELLSLIKSTRALQLLDAIDVVIPKRFTSLSDKTETLRRTLTPEACS